ncbi:MAG: shikimate dehydrogenase, partial [Rhodoferax sp.]
NRSWTKAHDMAQEFDGAVNAIPWENRHDALTGASLLVNTTNQGMHGETALDLRLDLLPANALVSDIIYVPLETPLLSAARLRGHITVNGLGMLLNQARPAFAAWFGIQPCVTPGLVTKILATF